MASSDDESVHRIESFVSSDQAWHQELGFDSPCSVRVFVENLGGGPIYGFYVDEADFIPLRRGEVTDEILERVTDQQLFEGLSGCSEMEVRFPAGKVYLCIELDCQSAPTAQRAEFRLTLTPVE